MLLGIGTDLLEIDRIKSVYQKHGKRFIERILTADEKTEAKSRSDIVNYLAKQFAAKESISKALGVGIGNLSFQDMEILRNASGQPTATISNKAQKIFSISKIHISLSDTQTHILAFCAIEKF